MGCWDAGRHALAHVLHVKILRRQRQGLVTPPRDRSLKLAAILTSASQLGLVFCYEIWNEFMLEALQ